ncbi:hypothetical protein [Sphingomonas aracearum]|uniref:hypothetical protein n=1 Tax=Sphingomonas aracearum TaxID=2283317 RepID=UPI0011C02C01|nr:hypothetical protein [Sphingomonas aracearum]
MIDVRREVCSAVDQIVAYRESAIALFASEPAYEVGIEAIRKILLNVENLMDVLELLKSRPELSDGAVFTAVVGLKVGASIAAELGQVIGNWGIFDPAWGARKTALERGSGLAEMAQARSNGVRTAHKLGPSRSAIKIKKKYLPLAEAITDARLQNAGAPKYDIAGTYY